MTVGISPTGGVLAEYIAEHADGGNGQTEFDWLMFILILLPNTNPEIGPAAANHNQQLNSILLIDNAPIHTAPVDEFIRAHGRRVVRLSPYSPDFAPVEMVFSKVNAKLAEITTPIDLEGEGRLALHLASISIFPHDCSGYFAACREHMMAVLPEITGPGAPLEGILDAAPITMSPW